MEKFHSKVSLPVAVVGEGTGLCVDIGQVYVHAQYAGTLTAEDKESGYREVNRWHLPRTQLTDYVIRQLFMKWSRDTGGETDVTLMGSHCSAYKRKFEKEISKSVHIEDKLHSVVNAFHGMVKHSAIDEILHEGSQRGVDQAMELMSGMKGFVESVETKFESGVDFSRRMSATVPSLPDSIQLPCLFVYVGSNTVFIQVNEDGSHQVLDMDSLGEAVFSGIGKHASGEEDIEKFLMMAADSDGNTVNMLGRDIKDPDVEGDSYSKFPDNMIIFPFGKAYINERDTLKVEDISQALVFITSATVAKLGIGTGVAFGLKNVYFGGTLIDNDEFRARMTSVLYMQMGIAPEPLKVNYNFIKNCGFYGTLGGLKSSQK